MESFFNFIKFIAVLLGIIIVILLVLLSLPNSKLRDSLLKVYAMVSSIVAIMSAIYIVSPIDILPDFIPVAGQSDDLVALVSAITTAVSGYVAYKKSRNDSAKAK